MTKSCGTCIHWIEAKSPGGVQIINPGSRQGECKESPPIPMLLPVQGGMGLTSVWPRTEVSMVCGHHQTKLATLSEKSSLI